MTEPIQPERPPGPHGPPWLPPGQTIWLEPMTNERVMAEALARTPPALVVERERGTVRAIRKYLAGGSK